MLSRMACVTLAALALTWCAPAAAEEWSRTYVSRLPHSAFAVVETAPDGRQLRHLPHHDGTGAVHLSHLRAARSRLGQVKWLDAPNGGEAPRAPEARLRAGLP